MTRQTKSDTRSDNVRRLRAVIPPSRKHRPIVYGANRGRVSVTAWSYPHGRGRELYVDVIEGGRHVAIVRVVARGPQGRGRCRA